MKKKLTAKQKKSLKGMSKSEFKKFKVQNDIPLSTTMNALIIGSMFSDSSSDNSSHSFGGGDSGGGGGASDSWGDSGGDSGGGDSGGGGE